MTPPRFSEDARQAIHIAMAGFALLLRFLDWREAALLAGAAVAFNFFVLPRIAGPRLYRSGEAPHRFGSGIMLYPVAILLLILVLPNRLDIVAAAWGVLACGDGMATVAGRRLASPRLPWNREKSIAGTTAFVIFGGAAGSFLCWWCRPAIVPAPYPWFSIGMPLLAAAAAAAVETIPVRLDDNLSVPATAAAVLWWTAHISEDLLAAAGAAAANMAPAAIAANAAVAAAGYLAGTVTVPGAIGGALLGVTILVTTGWGGWALLLATFGLAVLTSRVGLRRKMVLGIAEERGGRRGVGNALANTGVAAAAAVLAATSSAAEPARLAFVAALAAGGSDTVASEIGKAWGRRTYLLTTFRRVLPGSSGAISIEGTMAGLLGALALGALGVSAGLVPGARLAAVVAAATIGAFAEGLLGATLEGPGFVNNDILNFLNTAIAAAAALLLAEIMA